VLIDIPVIFSRPTAKIHRAIKDLPGALGFVTDTTRLIANARAADMAVVYAEWSTRAFVRRCRCGTGRYAGRHKNPFFGFGEPSADLLAPFRAQPGEVVAGRHESFNVFWIPTSRPD
jgi:hypothetical protein